MKNRIISAVTVMMIAMLTCAHAATHKTSIHHSKGKSLTYEQAAYYVAMKRAYTKSANSCKQKGLKLDFYSQNGISVAKTKSHVKEGIHTVNLAMTYRCV